jgi:MFS family permease
LNARVDVNIYSNVNRGIVIDSTGDPAVAAAEPRAASPGPTPLWRNWRFQLLWIGSSSATLGVEAADVAYPLLILAVTASPATAGLFGFVQIGTSIVLGLPAGPLVDRWDRRRVLLAAEGGRALAAGSVALALAVHRLTIPHLLIVAALLGVGTAFGGPVRMLLIRAVVPKEQLTQALSQDEVRDGLAGLAGPPLGGVLYAAGRALPFAVHSLSFLLSFLCAFVVRIPARARQPEDAAETEAGHAPGDVFAGVRELWRNQILRAALLMMSVFYLVATALTLVVVVILRAHNAPPQIVGLSLAGMAVGVLIGSLVVGRLHRLLSPGRLLAFVSLMLTLGTALLAIPLGPWWVFGVLTLTMLTLPSLRILLDILIFRQVPDHRRGRVMVATMTTISVGGPLGTVLAGVLLQVLPGSAAVLALAGLQGVVTLYALVNPTIKGARWPDERPR